MAATQKTDKKTIKTVILFSRESLKEASLEMPPQRVVILSASLAGILTAKYLSWERIPHVEIEIIHSDSAFDFSPLLLEIIVGSIPSNTLRIKLKTFLAKVKITVGEVQAVDYTQRTVDLLESDCGKGRTVAYDHLVIAFDYLPCSAVQHRHYRTVQNFDEAEKLREHIQACMQKAETTQDVKLRSQLLTFIVVGGGAAGVELISAIRHVVRSASQAFSSVRLSDCKFVIVEQRGRLLPKFPLRFSKFAKNKLKATRIDSWINSKVVDHNLTSLEIWDGGTVKAQTIIITCAEISLPTAPWLSMISTEGKVYTDEFLRVRNTKNVWAVGYAAHIPLISENKQSFEVAPDTPQFARQQARQLSRNIAAEFRGWNILALGYTPRILLIGTGRSQALASIFGFRFSGALGGWLRMVRLLIILPGLYRKLRLLLSTVAFFLTARRR